MRRFIATILALLFADHWLVHIQGSASVTAQAIQQAQNSGAAQIEKPQSPPVPAASPTPIQIPDGTPIDIEAPYSLNSMDFKPNDRISFRVVNPIRVNGVTVIESGATATGPIDKAKRGGHFGKRGYSFGRWKQ